MSGRTVTLDLDEIDKSTEQILRHLRMSRCSESGGYPCAAVERIATQIEAQTKPPKPAEPTGLGAVVEASDGQTWVRRHPGGYAWVNGYQRWAKYADINAVRVLSEGVPA